jgi:hypothetical protein
MNNKIFWLRIGFWWGIIQDAFYCFPLLLPEYLARPILGVDPTGNTDYINSCRSNFPLMLAWTILLLWADRKPLERKDVMLFTALIVAVKILITLFTDGFIWESMWVARLGTLALFGFSYFNALHTPHQTQKISA